MAEPKLWVAVVARQDGWAVYAIDKKGQSLITEPVATWQACEKELVALAKERGWTLYVGPDKKKRAKLE